MKKAILSLLPLVLLGSPALTAAPPQIPTTKFGRMSISDYGVDLIVHFEVGGRAYYEKAYSRPIHPGNSASGVTIGIGYDLRFSSRSEIAKDWGSHVSAQDLRHYQNCSGLRGNVAKSKQRQIKWLVKPIPLEDAMEVFSLKTIPLYASRAEQYFPPIWEAHPYVQDAVLSVGYNRGFSTSGYSRRHVADMKRNIASRRWNLVDDNIFHSKAVWANKPSIRRGIWRRRDAESLHAIGMGDFIPQKHRLR